MADKFVTFNEERPTPTGLPQAVDARVASRADLDSAIIGTGGVVSPSVSRIIASSDPDTPLDDGDLLLLYAPPLRHFEDWSDGLAGWKSLWTDEPWTIADGAAQINKQGSIARVALAYDSEPLTDVEIVAKINVATITPEAFSGGIGVRVAVDQGTQAYALVIFEGLAQFVRYHESGYTTLSASATYVPASGVTYWSRLRIQDGTLSARLWADGTPEPTDWQLIYGGLYELSTGQAALMPGSAQTTTQYLRVGIAEIDRGDEVAPVVAP